MSFLFDNNLAPAIPQALRIFGRRTLHVQEVSELGGAAPDELILQHAGDWDHYLVTRDRALTKTPQYKALIGSRRIGVILVRTGSARSLDAWGIAKLMVKAWDDIEAFADGRQRPFMCLVQANGRVGPYKT